jgi:hypothetical protein
VVFRSACPIRSFLDFLEGGFDARAHAFGASSFFIPLRFSLREDACSLITATTS